MRWDQVTVLKRR